MNTNQLGRHIQGGNAETKQQERSRVDREMAKAYRGRFLAEKMQERRELRKQIGDWL